MKGLSSLFMVCIVLIFCSCGGAEFEDNLEGKRKELKAKKEAQKELQTAIKGLEKEIAELDPSSVKKEKETNVKVDSSRLKNYEEYVEVFGTIETKGNYTATSEMPGNIISMNYKEGDNIQKGALVAIISGDNFDRSRDEIDVQLKLAKDLFERRERLWKQNIGSEIEFITARNNVEALEKKIASLNAQVAKTKVYAPGSGVVERVNLKQGELASPGVPILTIISTSNVQVVADVAENYLPVIKKGDKIEVEFTSLEMEREARITNIGTMINPANRTFKIEAKISNSDRKLKPNMQALIKIKQFGKKDAVVIPTNVILRDGTEDYVFIAQETDTGMRAKKKMIKTDRSYNGESLVSEGLAANELVIGDGKNLLKEGDLLKLRKK